MKRLSIAILCVIGAASVIAVLSSACSPSQASSQAPTTAIDQDDFTRAAEATVNGVVSIKSYVSNPYKMSQREAYSDPLFEYFFGSPQQRRQEPQQQQRRQAGLGSGVILSSDGYIVTNNHVIENAEQIDVTLNDNRNFTATVIGSDPTTDIALIKIDADNLHAIPMGDSDKLKIGQWVLAVGNPFGFTSSVTAGIVSAKGRNISSMSHTRGGIESFIQTDAAVNRGNSGGALVNLRGELVGINTAIYSQTGEYNGLSFAIPTSIVNKVVNDLKEFGTVQRAFLGITFQEVTPELIEEKGLKNVTSGIYVVEVSDRSAAIEAGLQSGDIIRSINGSPTNNTAQMQEAVAAFRPGDKISIKYLRDGKGQTVEVTLRNSRGDTSLARPDNFASLGVELEKVDQALARQLQINGGVRVAEVNEGRFADEGVQKHFVILQINGTRVSTPAEVERIYNNIRTSPDADKVMWLSGLYPSGKQAYYAVSLSD